jgi:ribosomal protein S6--L-glutamate ligase
MRTMRVCGVYAGSFEGKGPAAHTLERSPMYRIAIVSSDAMRDWASRELLAAANELAKGDIVDPLDMSVRMSDTSSISVNGESADSFDAFIVRGFNRQGEIDYQFEILELLDRQGHLVINSPEALSIAESKSETSFYLQKHGLPVPRTVVTQNLDDAAAAIELFGLSVLKPLYGSHGIGIERVAPEMSRELLPAFWERYGAMYIQEFVPNNGRDIRAFVVGDEVPAAMYRVAPEGQWKTNVFQGSSCETCEVTAELDELCLEAARAAGLDYTGVDVIEGPDGPVILELNGAPSWYGLSETTDRNIAVDVVSHVLRMLDTGQSARRPTELRCR